jgi:hypothetical protein
MAAMPSPEPRPSSLVELVAHGTIDADLAAHLWLLAEDATPLIVTGEASLGERCRAAAAVLGVLPERPWIILDADADPPTPERLAAVLRGGIRLGVTVAASGLEAAMRRLSAPPGGLPEDGVRRLGTVLVIADSARGTRVVAAHYLRPTERDAKGHVQRRRPAVLATWLAEEDRFEHFAWGITPELADRVDRSQADYESRHASRARLLDILARATDLDAGTLAARLADARAQEPPREPAPEHGPARPSAPNPLTDPHVH